MTGVNGGIFGRFRKADTNFASSCTIRRSAKTRPSGVDLPEYRLRDGGAPFRLIVMDAHQTEAPLQFIRLLISRIPSAIASARASHARAPTGRGTLCEPPAIERPSTYPACRHPGRSNVERCLPPFERRSRQAVLGIVRRPSHGLSKVICELAHDRQEVLGLPVNLLSDRANGSSYRFPLTGK